MTTSFNRMMQKVNDANKAEQNYINKVKQYNRSMLELKNNIQKIILPTEEAKLKTTEQLKMEKEKQPVYPPTDADKAIEEKQIEKEKEHHNKINSETHNLINILTKKLSGGFDVLIKKLISLNKDGKISTDNVLKALVELNDSSKISSNTATALMKELSINSDNVGDTNMDSSTKTLKELIAEISDNTNNINIELENISELLKASNINSKTTTDILTEIKTNGKISHDTQEKLFKEMIANTDSHGKEIETLLNKLNEYNLLHQLPPSYHSKLGSTYGDNEELVQDITEQIKDDDFSELQGRDKLYGIKRDPDGNTLIGNTKVNLKYNADNGLVDVKFDGNSIPFSVEGFIELFGQQYIPRMLKVTKKDFESYADIIKLTKMSDYNIDNEKNKKLITPIKKAMNVIEPKPNTRGNTIEKTIENNLNTLYQKLIKEQKTESSTQSHSGQGCGDTNTIILPSSTEELKRELLLIMASIKAGNNSTDMKNKASSIIDQLRSKKKITKTKEKELQTFLLNIHA